MAFQSTPNIPPIDDVVLQDLYTWVDQIPLSRPKRNFARDFSDAAMPAEIVQHYYPRYVELHNYQAHTSTDRKVANWHTLNRKVFKRLNFEISDASIQDIVKCTPYAVEHVLMNLRTAIDKALWEKQMQNTQQDLPEADQFKGNTKKGEKSKQKTQKPAGDAPVAPAQKAPVTQKTQDSPAAKLPVKKAPSKKVVPPVNQPPKALKPPDFTKNPLERPTATVPYQQYAVKERECAEMAETVQMLQFKISKMEELLYLKDMRIQELETGGKGGKVKKAGPTRR